MSAYFGKDFSKPRHRRNRDGSWSASASTGHEHARHKPAASQPSLSDSWDEYPAPVSDLGATPKAKRRGSKLRHSQQPSPTPDLIPSQPPTPDLPSPREAAIISGPVEPSNEPTESDVSTHHPSTETRRTTSRSGNGALQSVHEATPASHEDHSPQSQRPPIDHQTLPPAHGHLPPTHQRNQSGTSTVPTWDGEVHRFKKNLFKGGLQHLGPNIDANTTEVSNPRTWGELPASDPFSQPPADAPALPRFDDGKDDGGWSTPAHRCMTWVAGVSPTAPPEHELPASSEPKATVPSDDDDDEDLPPRPDSSRKAIPPTTVYYSDDSSSSPKIVPSTTAKSDASGDIDGDSPGNVTASPPSKHAVEERPGPPSTIAPLPPMSVTSSLRHTQGPSSGQGGKYQWSHPTKWWRQELHPMQNPLFASRRLCITTPFPLRTDNLKSLMYQHFTKYGPIRLVQPVNFDLDTADTVFVVFKEERSVHEILEDPTSIHCMFQSTSRTQYIPFDIVIRQVPCTAFTHFLWIKLTGPRPDARSRSASPSFGSTCAETGNAAVIYDTQPLPEEVTVWAVPHLIFRTRRLLYRVFVAGPGYDPSSNFQKVEIETGKRCQELYKINFGRRFPEKEIIAQLVDSFVDIISIIKPSERTNHGWIFECAGNRDVEELLSTVSDMPGITIRYANPDEYARPPSPAPTQLPTEPSPSLPSKVEQERSPSRAASVKHCPAASTDLVATSVSAIPDELPSSQLSSMPPEHLSAGYALSSRSDIAPSDRVSSKGSKERKSANNPPHRDDTEDLDSQPGTTTEPTEEASENDVSSSNESTYPGLVRKLVFTYRGRLLRKEVKDGVSRYIDDSAIFVGRLIKEEESQLTLLKRFERYGKITAIEYKPHAGWPQANFSRARILFQDKLSARLAIEKENGARSFGSTLKVELRRVLPHDVQMYLDKHGRAISPSMVSQYSPPSPPALPKVSLPNAAVPSPQHASRFNPIGATPSMPALMPTAMMVPAASVYGEAPDPQGMMIPVMWPMGFGMYPGMMAPPMSSQFQQASATVPAPPMVSPPSTVSPPSNMPRQNEPRSAPRTPETKATGSNPSSNTKATYGTTVPPTPPSGSTGTGLSSAAASNAPRVTGARYQDGLFTPTYDAIDLKRWREAQGIQDANLRLPSVTAPADREYLPLLPVFTGGHDPVSAQPAPPKGSTDPPGPRPIRSRPTKDQHQDRMRSEHPHRSFDSGASDSSGDAVRLTAAAAQQASNPAAREQIRAQLNQSFQVATPPTPCNTVPVPVPVSNQDGPSHARRGSGSVEQCESRSPMPERRKGDNAPRNRASKGRNHAPKALNPPRAFTPVTAPSPLARMADQTSEEDPASGW